MKAIESTKGVRNEWHCRDHKTDSFGAILRDIHPSNNSTKEHPKEHPKGSGVFDFGETTGDAANSVRHFDCS